MIINYEIEINKALEDAFLAHLDNVAAGLGREDRKDVEELIDHVKRTMPEEWNEYAKSELASYLMLLAGFQMQCGYSASDWEME